MMRRIDETHQPPKLREFLILFLVFHCYVLSIVSLCSCSVLYCFVQAVRTPLSYSLGVFIVS